MTSNDVLGRMYPTSNSPDSPGTASPTGTVEAPVGDAVSLAASCYGEKLAPRAQPATKAHHAAAAEMRSALAAAALPHSAAVAAFDLVAHAMSTGEKFEGANNETIRSLEGRWGGAFDARFENAQGVYRTIAQKSPAFDAAVRRYGLHASPQLVAALAKGRAR